MHAVSTNQIADILHFSDKANYLNILLSSGSLSISHNFKTVYVLDMIVLDINSF